jgi:DNA ligase-1
VNAFADLFRALDESNKTNAKLDALERFFREAPEADRLWALALFSGRRPKRLVAATKLARWAAAEAGIPDWLFAESYHMTGDLAETVSLLLPPAAAPAERPLAAWMEQLLAWRGMPEAALREALRQAWRMLPDGERLPFNKLLTGGMRLGVSANLVFKAVARAEGLPIPEVATRLSGNWHPQDVQWSDLLHGDLGGRGAQPFPFFLAHALDLPPEAGQQGADRRQAQQEPAASEQAGSVQAGSLRPGSVQAGNERATNPQSGSDQAPAARLTALLGDPSQWFAEWKWDGIRVQLLHHNQRISLWSRGEEELSGAFPELALLQGRLPDDCCLDGELLAFKNLKPLNFQNLQNRLNRKNATRALLQQFPVVVMAYDVLQYEGRDLRSLSFAARRAQLEGLWANGPLPGVLRLSPELPFGSWQELTQQRQRSREEGTEGLMLKRRASAYGVGRKRGDWFKWKVDPYTVDAVLLYAQRGHGRRAGLFTDFTFGVWHGAELLPFAKAYSGLDDAEVRALNGWIRDHTLRRQGPVVMLEPLQVFELAFEGIARSPRHRSGFALRFPRIFRWRHDKAAAQADNLAYLEQLLQRSGQGPEEPQTGDLFAGLP